MSGDAKSNDNKYSLGAAFLAGAATVLVGVITGWFDFLNKGRELDLELARLSLRILAGEYDPENDQSLPARLFALDALEKGTGVKIPSGNKDQWARSGLTPLVEDPRALSAIEGRAFLEVEPNGVRISGAVFGEQVEAKFRPTSTGQTACISGVMRTCGEVTVLDISTGRACIRYGGFDDGVCPGIENLHLAKRDENGDLYLVTED